MPTTSQDTRLNVKTPTVYTYERPMPSVVVDIAILSYSSNKLQILLIERGKNPHKGKLALPGGFLEMDETSLAAAQRELEEETGLTGIRLYLMGVFDAPDRDPRGRVISHAYVGITDSLPTPRSGDDAAKAMWHHAEAATGLAFDHDLIVQKALGFGIILMANSRR